MVKMQPSYATMELFIPALLFVSVRNDYAYTPKHQNMDQLGSRIEKLGFPLYPRPYPKCPVANTKSATVLITSGDFQGVQSVCLCYYPILSPTHI